MMRVHVVRAITVRIWTEIIRHHAHNLRLRIVEQHPSGGDYDTLSLFLQPDDFEWGQQLANLNTQAALFHPISAVGRQRLSPDRLEWPGEGHKLYLEPYLENPRKTIREIEAVLGLPEEHPHPLPPTTPVTLCYRLFAALLERTALTDRPLDMRSGWHSSSGWEGSFVAPGLVQFPKVFASLPSEGSARERAAAQYWLVTAPPSAGEESWSTLAVMSMTGEVFFRSKPNEAWDAWEAYKKSGREIQAITREFERRIERLGPRLVIHTATAG